MIHFIYQNGGSLAWKDILTDLYDEWMNIGKNVETSNGARSEGNWKHIESESILILSLDQDSAIVITCTLCSLKNV